MPRRRGAHGRGAHRRGASFAGRARDGAGARLDARRSGARRALECGRRRRADAGVLAREPRGHRAHVPRRSAAAHSRRRHARPPHPRQDQQGRLVDARRRVAVALRQRGGMGSSRHRQDRRFAQRRHAGDGARLAVAQGRRAADPQGRGPRHAASRTAIRHRPDDRGGARQRARARGARLHVFVRHAGRGGDDRSATPRATCAAYENAIHAIGRAAAGRGVIAGPGISVKLSALHPRYSRAQRERVRAELVPRVLALAKLARELRHRLQHRCRGSRPARPFARHPRRRSPAIRRSPIGKAWASSCRRTRSARGT